MALSGVIPRPNPFHTTTESAAAGPPPTATSAAAIPATTNLLKILPGDTRNPIAVIPALLVGVPPETHVHPGELVFISANWIHGSAQLVLNRNGDQGRPGTAQTRACPPGSALLRGSRGLQRYILCHMIEEAARHVGHLDIIRELIDGQGSYHRLPG
jgi:Protein of unknown function (DUF664)